MSKFPKIRTVIVAGAWAAATALPAAAQSTNWGGLYAGGHVGGGWADANWNHFQPLLPQSENLSASPSGAVGGGQLGLQHQWGNFVGGIEVSWTAADLEETVPSPVAADRSRSIDISSIFIAAARLGYAMDRSMFYVKGGYASANVGISSNVVSTGVQSTSSRHREDGWNIGVGWEYMWMPNVIVGLQYDYVSLDGSDRFNTQTPAFAASTTHHRNIDTDIHMATARISFKLGRDAPPPAPLK